MAVFSIIKKTQLEGAKRLDAEYYQSEYFIDFTKGKWQPLGSMLKKCQYGLSLAMNDEKNGVPMFKMDNIYEGFLFDDEVRYADVSEQELDQYELIRDDIFFNRVNSVDFVGRTGINKSNKEAVFASYLIRLQVAATARVNADYLNLFLNSKYGRKQIDRYARRAVNQANVNSQELKEFKVFIPSRTFQEKITKFTNQAWLEFENSKKYYHQAEGLLLQELGLDNFEEEGEVSNIVMLSEVKKSGRMDAEYFQKKYLKLETNLKKSGARQFKDVIQNTPAKFNPILKPEEIFKYVELSNINPSIGVIDGFSEVAGAEAPSRAKRVLKTGDVIVSSVEGSLGKVALVSKEQNNYLASTGFFQLRSEEILPEVLLVLAKSLVVSMQLEKRAAGTILTAVPRESIKNILIPVLTKPKQQKIAELLRQSHEARRKAKELLKEAKQKVEEIIERNVK